MSRIQTRRCISLNAKVREALTRHAAAAGVSVAEFVTETLRRAGVKLPKTEHKKPREKREERGHMIGNAKTWGNGAMIP